MGKPETAVAAPAAKAANPKLTHFHDVERFYRLGKLSAEEIADYRARGFLPALPGEEAANTMVLTPEAPKA